MTHKDHVKKALEEAILFVDSRGYGGVAHIMHDALDLLKEQEAEIEHLKRPDCEHAEHDGIGCLGYCGCTQDDEPIESCKRCEKYTGNVYDEVKWNEVDRCR